MAELAARQLPKKNPDLQGSGFVVGHTGLEPVTSALSRQRSEPAELMTLR